MISIKEWKEHFLSVSEIMGVYECEHWDIVRLDDHWKIIGKDVAYEFHSRLNGDRVEYTDLDLILGDLLWLEMQTRVLLQPENHWLPEDCPEVPWEICRTY